MSRTNFGTDVLSKHGNKKEKYAENPGAYFINIIVIVYSQLYDIVECPKTVKSLNVP